MKDVNKFEDIPETLDDDYFVSQEGVLYGLSNPYTFKGKKILCEDFSVVSLGHCRRCKRPMSKHSSIFYRDDSDYDGGLICKWVYSYQTGYCPDCIVEESRKRLKPVPKLPIHELIEDKWGNITEERVTYPDGEVIGFSWSEPKSIPTIEPAKRRATYGHWRSNHG